MSAFVADPAAVYALAYAFFEGLVRSGVEHVVVSPGSRSTPLTITARHTPGLTTWVDLDERGAAFFALGLAKESGRPVVLVCTSGTAAANYLPAIIEAHYSRVPLIVATTDRPAELRDWGAGQTIEQVGLYGRYVRWAVELPIPTAGDDALRYARQLAGRAVDEAAGTPSGAVHLNWPLREPLPPPPGRLHELLAGSAMEAVVPRFSTAQSTASPKDVKHLASLAREHERGVICAGPMDLSKELQSSIASFASASGWPVLADPASNLRAGIPPGGAPTLDAGDVLFRTAGFTKRHVPSVVIRIGDAPVSKAQRLWIEAADPSEVVWLDEGGQWGEPSHRATHVIRGGAASLLEGAAADLHGVDGAGGSGIASTLRERGWCRAFESANAVARKSIEAFSAEPDGFCGLSLAACVGRKMPANAKLFSSNSMSIRLLDLALANRAEPLRVFASRGASGIDGIPSTALGIAAASEGPTLLLTGDLAFLHDLSGLLLSRRVNPPLTIVVLDDNGGGIFSMLPVAEQGEDVAFHELFHTPHDVEIERVAALFELDYCRASDRESFESALEEALATPGISIVHVPIDAKTNERRFRATVAAAIEDLSRALGAGEIAAAKS